MKFDKAREYFTLQRLRKIFSPPLLRSFFMGPIYPIVVAVLVSVGYFTGLEIYLNCINMALAALALCVCDSIRPLIIVVWTFVFQISMEHTPSTNNITGVPSDYYFTEWRGVVLVLGFAAVFIALCRFYIRNRLITPARLRTLPHLLPTLLLALAFALGGAFTSAWEIDSLGFALVQIVMWFVIFYLMLIGFSKERGGELVDYLIYVASIVVIMLTVQLLEIYLFTDVNHMIDEAGNIIRSTVRYGWGVTNTAAQSLTVTIPLMFLGVMRSKHRLYYLIMATVATIASIFNMSRTAMVVGLPIYFILLGITVAKTRDKRRYVKEILCILAFVAVGIFLLREQVSLVIDNYIIRGTGDSGRYKIWENTLIAFREEWLFGKGFFGLSRHLGGWSNTAFIPYMAHNTPVHMLGCCGIFGFVSYVIYRACTAIPFIRKPNLTKGFIGVALLSVLLGSLLENFVFYILPMLSYSVIYAVGYKLIEDEKGAEITPDSDLSKSADIPENN